MTTTTKAPTPPSHECCMCGDYGFSYQLFQCKVCQFRSQHRYCSNLYPNIADSYRVCNWCLSQKDDTKEKSQNSSNSSSSNRNESGQDDRETTKNKKKNSNMLGSDTRQGSVVLRRQGGSLNLQIKKQRSGEVLPPSPVPSPAPSPATRKRIITNGAKEERLRRTRSEEISNGGGIKRQVFRNKVRRYKLLDEVSS
ncbi:hypothetical protein UlMin_034753 [Ulmus minor]